MSDDSIKNDDKVKKNNGNSSLHQRSFEIEYFARTNGITRRQAAELLKKYGNDYATLQREAKWLRE
jgi:hypothetical protein